ncbi:DUF1788 domain-containing protein [Salegentibacter sp. JZCK2]|uniref:DUF1788 domain-containing protein n=1 Tax=Salegentibacter tibetensis TaxID=2873600 RepID=UPI001CCFEE2A|nr:DUF1788 domain-containing protein [Salegentibacter tibetensis]MBZ9730888.1 DUF1788 domain-containing protein [Salegentibacter tibetensis]
MSNLTENFDHLYQVISSSNFLKKQSLGGEIPFFISAYDAQDQNEVGEAIRLLKNKLNNAGVTVLELNLYDIACEILENKGGIEKMFRVEQRKSKDKFLRALQSSLNIHQVLMPKISEMIRESEAKVYFLTGIGACYPFIRSHNVLNNLQNIAKDCPTVAFFPGEYNGHSLNLFGLLKDDNYYRAFNINTIKA